MSAQLSAYKTGESVIVDIDGRYQTPAGPSSIEVRYELEDRGADDGLFAALNDDDLATLWESLRFGASPTERGEIECYLCSVAEGSDD